MNLWACLSKLMHASELELYRPHDFTFSYPAMVMDTCCFHFGRSLAILCAFVKWRDDRQKKHGWWNRWLFFLFLLLKGKGFSSFFFHFLSPFCWPWPLSLWASKELFILSDLRKKKRAGTRIREQLEGQENSNKDNKDADNANNVGQRAKGSRTTQSHYAFNKQAIPPVSGLNPAH